MTGTPQIAGGKGTAVKISVDRDRCEGHAQCEAVAPDLFHVDDDGTLSYRYDRESLPPEHAEDAENAIMACPVMALVTE